MPPERYVFESEALRVLHANELRVLADAATAVGECRLVSSETAALSIQTVTGMRRPRRRETAILPVD